MTQLHITSISATYFMSTGSVIFRSTSSHSECFPTRAGAVNPPTPNSVTKSSPQICYRGPFIRPFLRNDIEIRYPC